VLTRIVFSEFGSRMACCVSISHFRLGCMGNMVIPGRYLAHTCCHTHYCCKSHLGTWKFCLQTNSRWNQMDIA